MPNKNYNELNANLVTNFINRDKVKEKVESVEHALGLTTKDIDEDRKLLDNYSGDADSLSGTRQRYHLDPSSATLLLRLHIEFEGQLAIDISEQELLLHLQDNKITTPTNFNPQSAPEVIQQFAYLKIAEDFEQRYPHRPRPHVNKLYDLDLMQFEFFESFTTRILKCTNTITRKGEEEVRQILSNKIYNRRH